MCGLTGIIGRIAEPNRTALRRMNAALAHRGPDGDGYWESEPDAAGRGAMLSHRRLSILDLSPAGAQPMVDQRTGNVVAFNGEVYNYIELRKELTDRGERLQSTGDTAVMLRALSLHGRMAVRTFRGMFAFAFWEAKERKLWLARDAFGIKPLYFVRNADPDGDWSLAFASEVRAILASGLLGTPGLNPGAIASIVWNGFVVAPETAVVGVESVWPGQLCVFDAAGKKELSEHFWSARKDHQAAPISEPELARTLVASVRGHLESDVPVGVFLSGGIDSSVVANLAQKASQEQVHTFTIAFEEDEYSEGAVARAIARAIGTHHQEVMLTEQRFVAELDDALDSLDQPTFDGLNSYYIAKAVREAGLKVALVGTGGDELFGGYESFRALPRALRWLRCVRWFPREALAQAAKLAASIVLRSRQSIPPQTRWAKLPDMVRSGDDPLTLYQLAYALFLPEFQRQLAGDAVAQAGVDGLPPALRARLRREIESRSPLSAISVLEQRLFLGERLLRDTDSTSMASAVEVRLPLVDQLLFESVDRLADHARYDPIGQKSMLRRIGLGGLDPELFMRPKSGFVLPYDRWLKTGVGSVVNQTLRDPVMIKPTGLDPRVVQQLWESFCAGAPGLYWSRIWAIYVFARWCHKHRVYI